MGYIIFEIFIFVSWAGVFLSRLRRNGRSVSEDLHVLLFALPTTILMEIRAEYLLSDVGTFYPASLRYFPDFKFPVAIILAGSLFAWAVYVLSRGIAARVAGENGWRFNIIHLVLFLLLLGSSRFIELIAVGIGYWKWYITPDPRAMWVGSYLYYFRFVFPAALAAKFFSWHENKNIGPSQAHRPDS